MCISVPDSQDLRLARGVLQLFSTPSGGAAAPVAWAVAKLVQESSVKSWFIWGWDFRVRPYEGTACVGAGRAGYFKALGG